MPAAPPPASLSGSGLAPPPTATASWRAAGAALRRGECGPALEAVAAEAEPARAGRVAPTTALLLEGLYAYTCDQPQRARDVLFLAGGRGTPFEDWRLLMLGESAAAAGDWSVAQAAYRKVLDDYPASPVRRSVTLKGLERAREVADAGFVFELAARARAESPDPADDAEREWAVAVERAAWEVAGQGLPSLGSSNERLAAGRRLLALDPPLADDLRVAELLEAETGAPPVLSPRQLRMRSERLLRLDRDAEAWTVLATISLPDRDFRWHELAARALIATRRGAEAAALLASVSPRDDDERARLAWQRARALREAATVRSGRPNPPRAEREELTRQEHRELRTAARLRAGDPSERALRRLFTDLTEDDRFDEARAVLEELQRLDPEDETGADHLWRRGWAAYRSGNPSGAVGYWAELRDLYPEARVSRAARYWTARALQRLGQRDRGREIFAEVAAADSGDLYRRMAWDRLTAADRDALEVPTPAVRPWPTDPALDRARFLTDVGLDEAALIETRALAGSGDAVDERAAAALEGLVLARLGEPRASIGRILRAFPELGTAHQDTAPREALELYYPLTYSDDIDRSARRAGLPLSLVLGMVRQESGFDRTALSRAGARGLMQLMPATAREVAGRLDLRFSSPRLEEPEYNTRLGTTYFRQVLDMFDGNVELALAGYNGGPYRIRRLWREAHVGGQPPELDEFLEALPVTESRIYVKRILLLSDSYRRLYDLES